MPLTWEDLAERTTPCSRCGSVFRVCGPLDLAKLKEVRTLLSSGRPIDAIRYIRENTASNLADAKATFEHVTIKLGTCRQCGSQLSGALLSDCSECGAFNIDA